MNEAYGIYIIYSNGIYRKSSRSSKSDIDYFRSPPSEYRKSFCFCFSDRDTIQKVVQQIEKRIDVLRAFFYTEDEIFYQEVALYKVATEKLLDDSGIEELIRRHNARILEVNRTYTVIEKSGHTEETQQLFEELSKFGVMQFVRSGRVAITKSTVEHVSLFLEAQECRRLSTKE
mgnify:CR=1 FL=1